MKADELEMIVFGLNNVDFGNKKVLQCLTSVQVGHAGSAGKPTSLEPEDHSGCVAWLNDLWIPRIILIHDLTFDSKIFICNKYDSQATLNFPFENLNKTHFKTF